MDRLAALICALGILAASASSQQPDGPGITRPRLLVMNNGRVVRGVITPRPGGYDVRLGLGHMYVASETVRFEAGDLDEAYHKLRDTFQVLTADTHLEIARWCITNHQVAAARQELLDALHLEPNNSTARAMLKRLEADVSQTAAKSAPATRTLAQRRLDQFMRSDHESLGGLGDRHAADFVSRVQPILERRCGNSSCHGSSSPSEFQLKRTRGRSSRLVAERNLAAVLKQIDFHDPPASPLLQAIDEPHTRDGRPVMPGRSGTIQRQIVLDWVTAVTAGQASRGTTTDPPQLASVPQTTGVMTAGGAVPADRTGPGVVQTSAAVPPPGTDRSGQPARPITPEQQKLLQEIRASNEPDPFDPSIFNRKYHGFEKRPPGSR